MEHWIWPGFEHSSSPVRLSAFAGTRVSTIGTSQTSQTLIVWSPGTDKWGNLTLAVYILKMTLFIPVSLSPFPPSVYLNFVWGKNNTHTSLPPTLLNLRVCTTHQLTDQLVT